MDLKTFADEDFDSKKWINKAWSSSGNQEKEIFVANTVTRLQLYMKQLTNSLDETTTQIVTSIPRILQDASGLQVEGSLLQQRLLALEDKVQGVEEETGHSIESLQRIDQLKSRLENAASTLREADKWAALATSLEDVLESGVPTSADKLNELADQVAAMTASLEVLSDAPDYDTKRLQLETLYNRLEAAVTTPLLEALTNMDADRTKPYVSVFEAMSRGVSVRRGWRRSAAARLANAWRILDAHSIRALTRLLMPEANTQVDWLTNVLKCDTPVTELIGLYTDLLLSLEPSPSKVVSANLKLSSTPEEGILLLTDLKRDIDEFVACIRSLIDSPRPDKETIPQGALKELGRAAYAPLRELLPRYTELQSQLLLEYLNDSNLKQDDIVEQSRILLTTAERCDSWLDGARSKARAIAGEAAYPYYSPAVEKIPQLPVWNNNDAITTDLPDFALSPQEYITEIGQYLMTLPQHLEMHLPEKQAPWQFLSEICTHTCEIYAEKILNIRNMDALGTKRCLTDIVYLSSVVEDLGGNVTPALKNLEKSLRATTPAQE